MNGPAHFNFAFNIQKFAAAHADLGCNSGRLAERITRKVIDNQPVDNSDTFAFNVQKDSALINLFKHFLFYPVAAVGLSFYGLFDMVFANLIGFRVTRPIVGFAQQIADGGDMCGQFFGIFGQTRGIFNNFGNRLFIQRTQVFLFGQ